MINNVYIEWFGMIAFVYTGDYFRSYPIVPTLPHTNFLHHILIQWFSF